MTRSCSHDLHKTLTCLTVPESLIRHDHSCAVFGASYSRTNNYRFDASETGNQWLRSSLAVARANDGWAVGAQALNKALGQIVFGAYSTYVVAVCPPCRPGRSR